MGESHVMLYQTRLGRAWLSRSYISSQMGIEAKRMLPCSFCSEQQMLLPLLLMWWKHFHPLSPSLLFDPQRPDAASRYSLACELVTHVISWQASHSSLRVGSFPAFSFNLAAFSVFISDSGQRKTHRYRKTVGVEEGAWCIVKAASSSLSFPYSHHLPKSVRQHARSLFIKVEVGQRGGEIVNVRGRKRHSVSERSLAAELRWNTAFRWLLLQ